MVSIFFFVTVKVVISKYHNIFEIYLLVHLYFLGFNPCMLSILLYTARSQHAEIENSHSQRGKSEQALLKLYSNFFSHPPEARKNYCKVLALPAHEFRVEVRVFNWGLLGELWYIISTTNIWVSVLGYVKNNIIQIFFFIRRKYYCLQLFYILLFSLIF